MNKITPKYTKEQMKEYNRLYHIKNKERLNARSKLNRDNKSKYLRQKTDHERYLKKKEKKKNNS